MLAPAKTARPQRRLIRSQPPALPSVSFRTTLATTPAPSRIRIAVPSTSHTKIEPLLTRRPPRLGRRQRGPGPAALPTPQRWLTLVPAGSVVHGWRTSG